eukprot:6592312-Lingulodinium_polyedra.AAC.1
MERWVAYYARPRVLRADPEGAWKAKELQSRLAEQSMELDIHAGQAPWQLSATEGAIRVLKDTATRIAKGRPELSVKEIWALATLAFAEEERRYGYSPA